MRRFLIVFAVLAFCSAPIWADSIEYDVNAWATFTAPVTGATDTIAVNFLYIPTSQYVPGNYVPGSLTLGNSGFLGTFSQSCHPCAPDYYTAFYNLLGDEVDLDYPANGIQTGINTVDFYMYTCISAACTNAEGTSWIGPESPLGLPTRESSVVTAVAIPDGDSFLWLSLTALASVGLVWRCRRRPEQSLAR
jgi:hypothetical protein